MSAALDRLRSAFSDPLLVRVGNRMEATPFARQLQGPLKTALSSVSLALSLPQKFDPARARLNFRLGVSDYVGLLLLPALHGVLAREAPGISLEVIPTLRTPRRRVSASCCASCRWQCPGTRCASSGTREPPTIRRTGGFASA